MENIIVKPLKLKAGESMLTLYVFSNTESIRKEIEAIDKDYSYETKIEGLWAIGTITIIKDKREVKRSATMKVAELDVYGKENNLFNKTATMFNVGFSGKIKTGYFIDQSGKDSLAGAINQRPGRIMEEANIKVNGYPTLIYYMRPTDEMIKRVILGEEVKDDEI